MRAIRYVVVALAVLAGGYLLGIALAVYGAVQDQQQGWHTSPPSHPIAHIIVYVSSAIGLQFVSAGLLPPITRRRGLSPAWVRYLMSVAFCTAGCFIAWFVLMFVLMALLDAGLI